MTALAKIHVAKKQLGLDDDTYRAVLVRVTGKESSKAMSPAEQLRVISEFERLGFKPAAKARGKSEKRDLSGPYAGKLRALWVSGWNLGVIRDRRDTALLAFVEKQTGIERTEWLRNPAKGSAVVDALKDMLTRDGGVDWKLEPSMPPWARRPGFQIAKAQHTRINGSWNPTLFWLDVHRALGRPGFSAKPTDAEWIDVMNAFGLLIRAQTKPERKKA